MSDEAVRAAHVDLPVEWFKFGNVPEGASVRAIYYLPEKRLLRFEFEGGEPFRRRAIGAESAGASIDWETTALLVWVKEWY